ncbi:MAG: DUF2195 family protein [Pseudomonadota bacterium]
MYRNLMGFFLLLSMALPAGAAERTATLVNYLESCVAPSNGALVKHGNALLYQVQLEVFSNIGNCGCRSMVGSYQVQNGKQFVRSEDLVLKKSRQVSLFVESDDSGFKSEDLNITLGCGREETD